MSDSDAVIARKGSYVVDLEPGVYWWCSCGRSTKQPFCDGSHKSTEFQPVKIVMRESKKVALCGCKHSSNRALCDGTHKDL